jgi:hypothetical protein
MKRINLGLGVVSLSVAVLAVTVAGCKKHDGGMMMGLPDGFVSTNCATVDDCAPTMCQTAKCNPVTHMCQYTDKTCNAMDDCNMGVCDEGSGMCGQQPANENMACMTMDGQAGACLSGTCTPVPTCYSTMSFATAECDSSDASVTQDNNGPMSFGGGMPVIGAYGCAPTEAGPEIAYQLDHDPSAGDEDITVSLRPVNADGTPASSDNIDLDLIILEDTCTTNAKCMNPMLSGGGYQGVTAGTAKERVTFHATAGKNYYVVVDGKDMSQIRDYVLEVEACGKCQPTDTTRLDCNVSTPLMGDTSKGAAQITDYKVGAAMTAVSAPGKEQAFYLRTADNAVRNATVSIISPSNDYRMIVTPDTFWGQCDVANAIDSKSGPAASAITWKIDPSFYNFARYWVIVDTPTATDATFGLQLSCAPYCNSTYSLTCGTAGSEANKFSTGTTIGGPTQAAKWGPGAGCDGLTGLVGPETAISFTTTSIAGTNYQFILSSKTAGKNLSMTILDAGTGTSPACDPTMACMTNTGTHTTNGATNAVLTMTAVKGHTYFIIVDGTDAAGADFDLQVVGQGGGAGCP